MTKAWKNAEKEFDDHFRQFGKRAFIHKLTDAAEVHGRTGRIGKMRSQPADRVVVVDNETFFAEIKSSSDKTAFRFSQIRKDQSAFARMILTAGGAYYIFLKRNETGEWFKIPYSFILREMESRKSMKWEELDEFLLREF